MVTQNARAAGPEATTQDVAVAGPELPRPPVTERAARFLPGLLMLVLGIVLIPAGVAADRAGQSPERRALPRR